MIGPESVFAERDVRLDLIKHKVARIFTGEVWAARSTSALVDYELDRMVVELRTSILAEKLPPQDHRMVCTAQRHASWWDHLKATYRGRWWWPRSLARVSYVDTPVVVRVKFQDYWAYPQASVIPPDSGLGRAVMVSLWEVDDGS